MKNNMENTSHTKHTRIMLLILAVVLLIASIAGYIVSRKLQVTQSGADMTRVPSLVPTIAPTLIPYPVKGSFLLKEATGKITAQVGVPFTLNLIATSSTDTVAGYDAILSYDKEAFERQSVESKADAFRIFTYERGTHLSISGTKNLQVTEPVRFTSTPILSFTFVAKKKGTYVFSLKSVGNESSKTVNESAQVTYPETPDFRLEIN